MEPESGLVPVASPHPSKKVMPSRLGSDASGHSSGASPEILMSGCTPTMATSRISSKVSEASSQPKWLKKGKPWPPPRSSTDKALLMPAASRPAPRNSTI